MNKPDRIQAECPADVVDRMLWRNAQRILQRHVVRLDGTCHWCGRLSPCSPRRLAQRADQVARLSWHEAWTARNEITRLLPALYAEVTPTAGGSRSEATGRHRYGRNHGSFVAADKLLAQPSR